LSKQLKLNEAINFYLKANELADDLMDISSSLKNLGLSYEKLS
jgi:hypothetical protein